ncbi:uncharacterized protein LOC129586883 [Paramacrobiotus metropolitanus]|uniref:uncharacterized protein LOC129586883 n=1 Tax=Paramacrobiotus metropolitanus TaxID=2943436 RepID=UPI0024461188|nr:uncharacterized protein LOC129586883 [Paramacrobiotus metropolitanus]
MKKDGGLRPIAVGNTLRRLAAKVICSRVKVRTTAALQPSQLGFGVKGGSEAIVHSAREFISSDRSSVKVLLKIDLKNAFNCISRATIMEVASVHLPEYADYLHACYGYYTDLYIDDEIPSSQCGVHQGDPLGPLLFSLGILPITSALKSKFNAWFLDDGTMGGSVETVAEDFQTVIDAAYAVGLSVNMSKCEIFVSGGTAEDQDAAISTFLNRFPTVTVAVEENLCLLGAPLLKDGIKSAIQQKTEVMRLIANRLELLPKHQAYFLLKCSLSAPKVIHLLRCCPSFEARDSLIEFDEVLRESLQSICNVRMDPPAWRQASLPVRCGGLGIRRVDELALPAYLASIHATRSLVSKLLPHSSEVDADDHIALWSYLCDDASPPLLESRHLQRAWDTPYCSAEQATLLYEATDATNKARLLATSTPESGVWTHALPSSSIGNLLDDESFRIAVAIRLGAPASSKHQCNCGAEVNADGLHGLSCKFSAGRRARHDCINDILRRALVSAGIPARTEPRGMHHENDTRPDGITTFPWTRGLCLAWDVTCVDTVARSYLDHTSLQARAAADQAEAEKVHKYSFLSGRYEFAAVGFETFGSFGSSAKKLVKEVGKRVELQTGEIRSHEFLKQNISLAIQRGNAASVMGTVENAVLFKCN